MPRMPQLGSDLAAAAGNREHAAAIAAMKEQLLIVLFKRLGAERQEVSIPVEEIDGTGRDVLAFRLEGRTFHFAVQKKS